MKLASSTLFQMLLSSRNVMALRQVLNDLFSDPTAIEDLGFRIGEPPLQVRYDTSVSALFTEVGRVVDVNLVVGTTWAVSEPEVTPKCITYLG